jgi:hypothetical protein
LELENLGMLRVGVCLLDVKCQHKVKLQLLDGHVTEQIVKLMVNGIALSAGKF